VAVNQTPWGWSEIEFANGKARQGEMNGSERIKTARIDYSKSSPEQSDGRAERERASQTDFATAGYYFVYGSDGRLYGRYTPVKNQNLSRDYVGRVNGSSQSMSGTSLLNETIAWNPDGTQSGNSITRNGSVSASDPRTYGYNQRGELLLQNFSPSSGQNGSATYQFDGGAAGGLGLRTGVTLGTAMSGVTAQSYGTFARLGSMSVSGSLTNNSVGTPVAQSYDAAGNVTTRTAGGSTDTLTWDAFGQLVKDVRTGTGAFTWSAVYDGLGRRLQTTQGTLTVQSSYDPEVEFLELVTTINGVRNWHVTGPDLDGRYGGLNGCGGVEAIYNQSTSSATYLLSDTYGHGEGVLNGTTFTWNPSQSDGYGALAGSSAATPINASSVLGNLIGWRGHYIDATGLYYLGARYYAPDSGTFLSPDPLGHSASMDLYSYCNGDPVNQYDADGRFGVGALTGQSYNSASSLGAIFGGSTLITQSTQMASSLVQSYQGNLQMFDGNQYNAINATVNPAYTAIAKYNEATDGIGYSYNNLGNSLSTGDRVFSGVQSAVAAVSTVGAGFGGAGLATASGLTAPAENIAAEYYLNRVGAANGASLYNSFVPGTARLNIGFGGQNAFRAADSIQQATEGRFASLEMPSSPAQAIQQNALAPQFRNNASQLFQVTTRSGFSVQGTAASQGVGFEGGATQIFQSHPPGAIGPWKSVTRIPYISQ
jgi:RHS repeat-associated protein